MLILQYGVTTKDDTLLKIVTTSKLWSESPEID